MALVLLLIGITLVAFVLTHEVPGDPAAGEPRDRRGLDPVTVAAYHHRYGLDKPLPVQYGLYLWHLLHGDLGHVDPDGRQREQRPHHLRARDHRVSAAVGRDRVLIGVRFGIVGGLRQ